MEDKNEKRTVLQLEENTAEEAAKGACNMAWIRVNAFVKCVINIEHKYTVGKVIHDTPIGEWSRDLGNARHSLEMMFNEFQRAEYYKTVAREAGETLLKLKQEEIGTIIEETEDEEEGVKEKEDGAGGRDADDEESEEDDGKNEERVVLTASDFVLGESSEDDAM